MQSELPVRPNWINGIVAVVVSGAVAVPFSMGLGLLGCLAALLSDALGLSPTMQGVMLTGGVWLGLALAAASSILAMSIDPGLRLGLTVDQTRLPGGLAWIEHEHGVSLNFRRELGKEDTPDHAEAATLGGFALSTPDRQTVYRDAVRIAAGMFAATIAVVVATVVLMLQAGSGMSFDPAIAANGALAHFVAVSAPVGAAFLLRSAYWQSRRALTWTDTITLEGSVLRTERGSFHFREPDPEMTIEQDALGSHLTLRDSTQELSFRAPHATLLWVQRRLAQVQTIDGSAEDVPDALKAMAGRSAERT